MDESQRVWRSVWTELMGSEVRFIKGKRFTTRVIEAGSGDPLIMVHGVGGHAETFARNVMNLAQHFHVYAIDALFHGYSGKEHFDPEQMTQLQVEAIIDLLDAEGLKWAHVGGESMGSNIAFTMGLNYPDRCGKLILNTGAYFIKFNQTFVEMPGGGDELMKLSQAALMTPTRETMRARLNWLVADPARITEEIVDVRVNLYSDPAIHESMLRVFGVTAPRANPVRYGEEDVKQLKPPALVFWTEKNPGAGPDVGEYFASLIPDAKYYLMMDAAHWPQWERPQEHDKALIDFLKDN
jgi:pimeloyl-ACP methyl ester carboxylesterase